MSWGTTLGLAYAQAHPRRVNALVLALVTATSRREVEWMTRDVGRIFPREWERFAAAVPERLRQLPLVDAYAELLADPDPAVRDHAAREWCAWEDAHVSLTPGHQPNPRYEDPEFRYRFARLVTHYWRHAAFLGGGPTGPRCSDTERHSRRADPRPLRCQQPAGYRVATVAALEHQSNFTSSTTPATAVATRSSSGHCLRLVGSRPA